METAKIVDAHGGGLIPSSRRDGKDAPVDGDNSAVKLVSQEPEDQHSSAVNVESQGDGSASPELRKRLSKILRIPRPKSKGETEKSHRKQSSTKRRNKTLRFSARSKTPGEEEVEHLSSGRPSANPKLLRIQAGRSPEKGLAQRLQRSSSTEAVVREASVRRMSLFRSSSEQECSTQVLATGVAALAARNSSRRWRGDAFPTNEQEEGELDSIFRFIGECTRAVLKVLNDIPKIISELPKRTKEALDRLLLLVQGRNVPLLEGPTDSSDAQ